MAKGTRHAPAFQPQWNPTIGTNDLGASILNITLDAVGEKAMAAVRVVWADYGTHDLASIRWLNNATHTSGTDRVAVRAVDNATGPPMRDDGSDAGGFYVDHTNLASGAVTSTLGTTKTNVATGDEICVVWECTAHTSGSLQPGFVRTGGNGTNIRPAVSSYLSAAYATTFCLPAMTFVAGDGTLGWAAGGVPQLTSIAATSFKSDTSSGSGGDERALAITPADPCWFAELGFFMLNVAGGSFDIVVYEGTTVKHTMSVDANTWPFDAIARLGWSAYAEVAATSSTSIYLALKPTTTTNVTWYLVTFAQAGDMAAWAPGCGTAVRTDGGAWGAVSTTTLPWGFRLGSVAEDDGAGGSGGNANILRGSVVA